MIEVKRTPKTVIFDKQIQVFCTNYVIIQKK